MTINQYLCMLEVKEIQRERCFERYVRIHNQATAPAAAHINTDGTPKIRSGYNSREEILIKAADALADFYKAFDEYREYYKQLTDDLAQLDYKECIALELIYIDNRGKPPEKRRAGLCRRLGVRTKAEANAIVRQAKQHLKENLRAQGIEIE